MRAGACRNSWPALSFRYRSGKPQPRGEVFQKRFSTVKISDEIRQATADGDSEATSPVVALETAIYTHGFPYPDNIALASRLESLVRLNGGIPATIGILNGVARIGFESEELIELCSSAGKSTTMKVSTRDLPYICGLSFTGHKLNGGTTIAGTMALARIAGIKVLATGGLGGVHRGGEKSMDISADLVELGRSPVTVVSSGCKSFLDIPRTLEYLETQGVTVGTFADGREGQVDFPAFWTRDSGVRSPFTIKNETEAAAMMHVRQGFALKPSILFANPIPAEHSIAKEKMDNVIAEAVREAEAAGVAGHQNTPFILKRIRELTEGESVSVNQALVEANVVRGTRIAVEFAKLDGQKQAKKNGQEISQDVRSVESGYSVALPRSRITATAASVHHEQESSHRADVLVAGSLAIDTCCDYTPPKGSTREETPQASTSNPASISHSLGGVGQNIATAIHYLGTSVQLSTAIGTDAAGTTALEMIGHRALQTAGIRKVDGRTAQYVAINDAKKNLVLAMADMNILEKARLDFEGTWKPQLDSVAPKWVVVDANWDPETLWKWLSAGKAAGAKVAFEPVSVAKSKRLFSKSSIRGLAPLPDNLISLATPNAMELASMHTAAQESELFDRADWWRIIDSMGMSSSGSRDKLVSMTTAALVDRGIPQQAIQLLPFLPTILTKLGDQGVLMTQLLPPQDPRLTAAASAPYILSRSMDDSAMIGGIYMRLFPPAEIVPDEHVVSVNGVGDTFLGVVMAGVAKDKPNDLFHLVEVAQRASVMTLKSEESVSPQIATLRSAV